MISENSYDSKLTKEESWRPNLFGRLSDRIPSSVVSKAAHGQSNIQKPIQFLLSHSILLNHHYDNILRWSICTYMYPHNHWVDLQPISSCVFANCTPLEFHQSFFPFSIILSWNIQLEAEVFNLPWRFPIDSYSKQVVQHWALY